MSGAASPLGWPRREQRGQGLRDLSHRHFLTAFKHGRVAFGSGASVFQNENCLTRFCLQASRPAQRQKLPDEGAAREQRRPWLRAPSPSLHLVMPTLFQSLEYVLSLLGFGLVVCFFF